MYKCIKNFIHFVFVSTVTITITACVGQTGNSNVSSYYSAATNVYYQVQSSSGKVNTLIYTTSAGSINLPLEETQYGIYKFVAPDGQIGNVILHNNYLGFVSEVQESGYKTMDFATNNPTINPIPDGTYNTLCEYQEPSPCLLSVNSQKMSVEITQNGVSSQLCAQAPLIKESGLLNKYLYSYSCKSGSNNPEPWQIMQFTNNGKTGIMIAEMNNANLKELDFTSEVAFPVTTFNDINSLFYYVYLGQLMSRGFGYQSGYELTGINNTNVINPLLEQNAQAKTCSMAYNNESLAGFNTIICDPATSSVTGGVSHAFTYYFIGNPDMGLFMDSSSGFYF